MEPHVLQNHPLLIESEAEARRSLIAVAQSMLSGEISFIEGAVQVLRLRSQVGGVSDRDPDFDAFVLIESETEHLPLAAERHMWLPESLIRLEPEIKHAQEWASAFAPEACEGLIARFSDATESNHK